MQNKAGACDIQRRKKKKSCRNFQPQSLNKRRERSLLRLFLLFQIKKKKSPSARHISPFSRFCLSFRTAESSIIALKLQWCHGHGCFLRLSDRREIGGGWSVQSRFPSNNFCWTPGVYFHSHNFHVHHATRAAAILHFMPPKESNVGLSSPLLTATAETSAAMLSHVLSLSE